jgi:hypothetical protein
MAFHDPNISDALFAARLSAPKLKLQVVIKAGTSIETSLGTFADSQMPKLG